jgi:hypothetical protein
MLPHAAAFINTTNTLPMDETKLYIFLSIISVIGIIVLFKVLTDEYRNTLK